MLYVCVCVCVCVCVYTFIFPFIFISWRLITLHIVVLFVDMNLYTHINGHLDCFHVFAFVNSAAINIRVHVSFWISFHLSMYGPRSEITGSYGSSVFKGTTILCSIVVEKWKVKVKSLSCVRLFEIPWNVAHHALLSMGFSRQEYWSGLQFLNSNRVSEVSPFSKAASAFIIYRLIEESHSD